MGCQSSHNRHISKSTVQRRLHESGLHGFISEKKPLLNDTNKKKRLALGQETRAMDIRPVEICPLVWVQTIFGSNRLVFVRRRVGERMISTCVVPTVKHGGGGVNGGALLVTLSAIYFQIQGTLNQYVYHRILQRFTIPSDLRLEGLSFVFQQDNDPTHL